MVDVAADVIQCPRNMNDRLGGEMDDTYVMFKVSITGDPIEMRVKVSETEEAKPCS